MLICVLNLMNAFHLNVKFFFFSTFAKLCEKQNKLSSEILVEHEVRIRAGLFESRLTLT